MNTDKDGREVCPQNTRKNAERGQGRGWKMDDGREAEHSRALASPLAGPKLHSEGRTAPVLPPSRRAGGAAVEACGWVLEPPDEKRQGLPQSKTLREEPARANLPFPSSILALPLGIRAHPCSSVVKNSGRSSTQRRENARAAFPYSALRIPRSALEKPAFSGRNGLHGTRETTPSGLRLMARTARRAHPYLVEL